MNRRGLMSLAASALVLAAALIGLPQAAADSEPIALAWDSETSLVWHPGSAANAMGSFFGPSTIVPGDKEQRTIWVRNDGPSAATASVAVLNVAITGQNTTASDYLQNTLRLNWKVNGTGDEMTWREATRLDTVLFEEFKVAQGDTFALTIGYYFPTSATGGMSTSYHTHRLAFDVRITLTESTETDTPDPPDPPDPPDKPGVPGGPGTGQTGGAVLNRWAEGFMVAMSGAALFVILMHRNLRREENTIH